MIELTEAEVEALLNHDRALSDGETVRVVEQIIDARLAPIRALADDWQHDGGGCAPSWCRICQLRAALGATTAPLSAQQDHDGGATT